MANYPEKISAGHLELSIRADAGAVVVKCDGRLTSEVRWVTRSVHSIG